MRPFGFSGGLSNKSGRTVHFGARDYEPFTSRWLQADPSGALAAGGRYAFANGGPVAMEVVANGLAERFANSTDHYLRGTVDKTHVDQSKQRRDEIQNLKNKYYRQEKCDKNGKDDHDDWMNGNGAFVEVMQYMPLPPYNIDNTGNPHGRGRKRPPRTTDFTSPSCPSLSPVGAAGWGR